MLLDCQIAQISDLKKIMLIAGEYFNKAVPYLKVG